MNLANALRSRLAPPTERDAGLSIDDFVSYFTYNGIEYPTISLRQTLVGTTEEVSEDFGGLVASVYRRNGIVFACMAVRARLFSEARFMFRALRQGRPGDLFATPALRPLETPWPNGTTGDLLTRAISDVDIAGNAFFARRGDGLQRLRPDWVQIVLGGESGELDVRPIGYTYTPGGPSSGNPPEPLNLEDVAHWAPIPDPIANFRGMSWLTPVIREIAADGAATSHKLNFFKNGATPNMVVKLGEQVRDAAFARWIELFEKQHTGVANAYKTLYLGGGADVTVVGSDLRQVDFKVTQGAGETRIAAAAGVPPIVVGLSEGLEAATYSNYGQARRAFADGTMRPLWRDFCASIAKVVEVPGGSNLWYDDRDISFLQEDESDDAKIQQVRAASIRTLTDAGFTPESVVDSVISGDFSRLVHSGLYSVQLQAPGTSAPAETAGRAIAELVAKHLNGGG